MADDRTALMSARALNSGYEILWYTIQDVLGQGGFGITYLAEDRNLGRAVAIKEYLPTSFAFRHNDYSVKPLTGDHGDSFAWGLSSFMKEAQTLAKFDHDNIVRVHSVFEQNSTAYMVMEYEQGDNLRTVFRRGEAHDQAYYERVFFPIFNGLKQIHEFGFIHRDIKPANIYIRGNGTPVLIDFGSARQTSQQQTGEMTTLVSQGYTPIEQYSVNYGPQGPWTDIYSLAATLYEGVTGSRPEEALSRSACMMRKKPDSVSQLSEHDYPNYSQAFLDGVIAGLALEPEGRPQSLDAWLAIFKGSDSDIGWLPDSGSDDNDRTRIQPPRPAANDPQTSAGFTHRGHTTSMPTEARVRPVAAAGIDDLPFVDDDFDRPADWPPASAPPVREQMSGNHHNQRRWLPWVAGLGAIVLASGAGLFFLGDRTGAPVITADVLSAMPVPPVAVSTDLPKDRVLEQLVTSEQLAGYYRQAYAVDPDNTELLASIARAYDHLTEVALTWHTGSHPDVSALIQGVAANLPNLPDPRARLQQTLNSINQRSDATLVADMLARKQYVSPTGNSVIDIVGRLNPTDLREVTATAPWQTMMRDLQTAALVHLRASDYDATARVVEAGLTLQPDDTQLLALQRHLAVR